MHKSILLIACALVVLLACHKDNPAPPPVSDIHLDRALLLYLPFNGNFADSSGHGNPTSAVGGAALTYDEHGNANSAFGGSGTGQRVLVTNNGSIRFDTALSFSCDVMLRAPGRYGFIDMVDNTSATSFVFGVGTNSLSPYNMLFATADSSYLCESTTNASNITGDSTSLIPEPESWYNVIAIYNKGTMTTYVNGQVISVKMARSAKLFICPNAKIDIGGWWDGDPASINGKIDEVRLYDRVLNVDEIAQLSRHFQSPN